MAKLKECIGIVLFTIFIEVVLLDKLDESENIKVSIKYILHSVFIKLRFIPTHLKNRPTILENLLLEASNKKKIFSII